MAKIALVDDHKLLRRGLAELVEKLGHIVVFEADNGKKLSKWLSKENLPDIVLLDINMPEMNGFETAAWLKKNHPSVNVLALSMYDNEPSVIRMLKNGARGYIMKDDDPAVLNEAIDTVMKSGFYHSEIVTARLMKALKHPETNNKPVTFSDKETEFLCHCCSDMTYKEIAEQMGLSPRTIDNYRDQLFAKLNLKSRAGLVVYAIKNGLVNI